MADKQVTLDMDELRTLVRAIVLEILAEVVDDADPDMGLVFKPEVERFLENYKADRPQGVSLENVIQELGLDI